ncbi:MAG: hypothetical protein DU429_06515 [Candidatus Tokpelaia sp.]|nr:MAG: hypothetical protein DU429_06515 [Candidatus Tokpelaia sp.]
MCAGIGLTGNRRQKKHYGAGERTGFELAGGRYYKHYGAGERTSAWVGQASLWWQARQNTVCAGERTQCRRLSLRPRRDSVSRPVRPAIAPFSGHICRPAT